MRLGLYLVEGLVRLNLLSNLSLEILRNYFPHLNAVRLTSHILLHFAIFFIIKELNFNLFVDWEDSECVFVILG